MKPAAPLDEWFRQTLATHGWLPPRTPLVVGLSGGADSMALMRLLLDVRDEFEWPLTALHVHHGLRGDEADEDARFVEEWCAVWGIPFRLERRGVESGRGQSIEMAARTVRRAALVDAAHELGGLVVVAHHADDQAETVLLRILRGTGTAGLAAMEPVAGLIRRPLLQARRLDLRRYLADRSIPWREDSTNRDPHMTRNRVRHDLLPHLRAYNPQVEAALVRLAESARDVEAWADSEARRWVYGHARSESDGAVYRLQGLRGLPAALAARALRLAAEGRGVSVTEAQVRRALTGDTMWPGDLRARWDHGDLVLERIPRRHLTPAWPSTDLPVKEDAVVSLPVGELRVMPVGADERGVLLDKPLVVRAWRPGDRIEIAGVGDKKIQDIFVDAKIPKSLRAAWPIVAEPGGGRTVAVVPGLVIGAAYRASPGEGWRLEWRR